MGGLFGVISKEDCIDDLLYGTDYHSHLGTRYGGLAIINNRGIEKHIHNISNAQFRSRFEEDIKSMKGNSGIGVISDYEPQPLTFHSHLGDYAIVTVGVIKNIEEIAIEAEKRKIHFSEISGGERSPTELVSSLIDQGDSFEEGIQIAQEKIKGSCSLLLLTKNGIYAARDKLGRTPLVTGKKEESYAVTFETCAFPNLNFEIEEYMGPGEIVLMTPEGYEQKKKPRNKMQICSFLWVYYGFPASDYEGINVEVTRNKCGEFLAKNDDIEIDLVTGIPDSGRGHAAGYVKERKLSYERPFVKYNPTWARSFMPQEQEIRELVAKMKLIPIKEFIQNKRLLFCEDSIVRGTQLQDIIQRLYDYGAKEVHMRPACPPLVYGCQYLNFSRSKSELDYASRKAIRELEGKEDITKKELEEYSNPSSKKYHEMVERISHRLGLTSLKYQKLENLVKAIGLPKEKLCTHCWDGSSYF